MRRERGISKFVFAAVIILANTFNGLSQKSSETCMVTYIANEGFMIETANHKILVDALFGGIEGNWCDQPSDSVGQLLIKGIPPFDQIDLVIVTHYHVDHFNAGMVTDFMKNHPESVLLCSSQTKNLLDIKELDDNSLGRIYGLPSVIPYDTTLSVNDIIIQPMRSNHGAYLITDENTGLTVNKHIEVENFSYLVEADGFVLFHSGDGSIQDKALFQEYGISEKKIDLAFFDRTFMQRQGLEIIEEVFHPENLVFMHIEPGRADYYQSIIKDIPGWCVFKSPLEKKVYQ